MPDHQNLPSANGAERIASERRRQIEVEGWTPEHDVEHAAADGYPSSQAALVQAAIAYLTPERAGVIWPWHWRFYKPSQGDRVRELTKAGALIAAEIDRLLAQQEADRG